MIESVESNGAGSTPIAPGEVRGVLEDWLDDLHLAGVDAVRAKLALSLAAELDDPTSPEVREPRVASELRAVLTDIAQVTNGDMGRRMQGNVDSLLAEVGA